jgi:hypothetical protein
MAWITCAQLRDTAAAEQGGPAFRLYFGGRRGIRLSDGLSAVNNLEETRVSAALDSTIMELPSEKDGRFLPFMTGGVVYRLILLPSV